jgi:dTDP-4-dehydrorhamnose 3,5-epimerase
MEIRELAIPGAWEITPVLHNDSRGVVFEWFTDREFRGFAGHRFDLHQANCSTSSAGVLRGLHFARLPPSQAKYVTCLHGSVFDVVVDIRVGSPTYGQWDSVLLDDRGHKSVYVAEGLAHAFLALQDDSTVLYLCSAGYDPAREHTIRATDPALGIQWPSTVFGGEVVLSERDADAPTLEKVRAAGLLPTWDEAAAFVDELRARHSAG